MFRSHPVPSSVPYVAPGRRRNASTGAEPSPLSPSSESTLAPGSLLRPAHQAGDAFFPGRQLASGAESSTPEAQPAPTLRPLAPLGPRWVLYGCGGPGLGAAPPPSQGFARLLPSVEMEEVGCPTPIDFLLAQSGILRRAHGLGEIERARKAALALYRQGFNGPTICEIFLAPIERIRLMDLAVQTAPFLRSIGLSHAQIGKLVLRDARQNSLSRACEVAQTLAGHGISSGVLAELIQFSLAEREAERLLSGVKTLEMLGLDADMLGPLESFSQLQLAVDYLFAWRAKGMGDEELACLLSGVLAPSPLQRMAHMHRLVAGHWSFHKDSGPAEDGPDASDASDVSLEQL